MFIMVERFGKSYSFDVLEGYEEPEGGVGLSDDADQPQEPGRPRPEICLLDAVDAVTNLLRSVFPEMEGYHLEVVEDNRGEGEDDSKLDGGIDLGKN